ncbi:chemotaxis protein CheB [Geodermatophilus sp. YIM 151500]|uniref:chemotaxis protein CheB n=1 Tax=Geodermatophilus sp. YIM 151500 TaxID=2984531 RepID=UPI0021E3F33F|nr:chemotaxis protein CheB [Geodermatophilus sp. YIM 151500]MCV2491548.1 chemotaxis protein CheB [Geodermatophilus sp. YIM 151500]
MAHRDVVVGGASAGGVEALRGLVAGFPPDLPAAVLVVLHLPSSGGSALAQVLDRAGPLPARPAREGAPLEHGTVSVAVPDRHLLLSEGDRLTLSMGPRENGHRPAVDALFRSAAHVAGARVIGVVLSGALDDGAAGLVAVAARGGVPVVQDPEEALYPSMPRSAAAALKVEHVLPAAGIGALLGRLSVEEVPDGGVAPLPLPMRQENAMAAMDDDAIGGVEHPGSPVAMTCPDCHGPLFSIPDESLHRYRCLVGHGWSAESLAIQQNSAVEGALWMALRSLEEKAQLARTMGDRARASGHALTGERFDERAADAHRAALLIRDLLERATLGVTDEPADGVA